MTPSDTPTRCALVAVIGAPNAGKSTLVNQAVGAKVTIVTHKVQTTRSPVRGIALRGDSQLVFVDTPGIFAPRRRLERAMVAAAWQGAADADLTLLVIDALKGLKGETGELARALAERIGQGAPKALVALNKVDALERSRLLELAAEIDALGIAERIFMISALNGDGVGDLLDHLAAAAPPGPWLFDPEDISDLPQRLLAAEITREQVYLNLHQELPYAATVRTESWTERKDGSVHLEQTIEVARDSQRAIVLGKGGATVKRIGQRARAELESLLERRVHLFLHVKVVPDWAERRDLYSEWGLEFDA
ncbi:GTPase Era [Roseospirillum parvum]|uniref:GTPase Era n=1 Tax=Roseospirillum parvum TaxID=83401 RepID=A0A1G7YL21_9PROT|nr:GTPase Era [Roseospirillum parvum]SDG97201.1 GTP-binding protein Era [Roseospirillum parvum]